MDKSYKDTVSKIGGLEIKIDTESRTLNPFTLTNEQDLEEAFQSSLGNVYNFIEVYLEDSLTPKEKDALYKAFLSINNQTSQSPIEHSYKKLLKMESEGYQGLSRLLHIFRTHL